jgi:hypothetical protein
MSAFFYCYYFSKKLFALLRKYMSKLSKHILITFFLFLVFNSLKAQYKLELGSSLGSASYIGDVGGYLPYRNDSFGNSYKANFYKKYIKWNTPRVSFNTYARYKINKWFAVKATLGVVHIEGSDSLNIDPNKLARNLSFRTNILELGANIESNVFLRTYVSRKRSSYRRKGAQKRLDLRGYFFTGLGAIYFSPRAKYINRIYKLRPLATEGEKYSPVSWSLPLGVGFTASFSKNLTLGISYSYHFTGTDYLDDVSKVYAVGYKESADNKNQNVAGLNLSNRTPEVQTYSNKESKFNPNLPEGKYFERNDRRGNSTNRDGYFIANISVGYMIKGKNKFYRSKSRQLEGKKKITPKKFRAKF